MIEVLFYQNGDGKERVALKVVRANYRDLCGQYLPGEGRSWCKGGREFRITTNQYGWSRVTRAVKLGDRAQEVAGAIPP